MKLQNYEWLKDPFQVKGRQVEFNLKRVHWYGFKFLIATNF